METFFKSMMIISERVVSPVELGSCKQDGLLAQITSPFARS